MKIYRQQNMHFPFFNPVDVGCEQCKSSHHFGPKMRSYYLIHFIMSGKGIFRTKNGEYTLLGGMCFVIHPGEITYYEADKDDPWKYVWIGFESNAVPECIKKENVLDAPSLMPLFRELEDNIDTFNGAYGDGGVREAYLCGKITEIMMRLDLMHTRTKQPKVEEEIHIIKNYIDTHISHPLSVQSLASQFHLSSAYLSRIFKKIVGISPQKYIVKKRLDEAARLMSIHSFSPTAAANAVGYEDIFLFSKMFKRYYGSSPREYAKDKKKQKSR